MKFNYLKIWFADLKKKESLTIFRFKVNLISMIMKKMIQVFLHKDLTEINKKKKLLF